MERVFLHIPALVHQAILGHLLPADLESPEAAGFMFVRHVPRNDAEVFEHIEWYQVPPDSFLIRTGYHFELTDETRAKIIKRAHDLEASLVEFHSHTGPWPAAFSPSDQLGFQEFVPHIWWRLKGKPYLAIVITRTDFDALAWIADSKTPQHLDGIVVEGSVLTPTQLSSLRYDSYEQ